MKSPFKVSTPAARNVSEPASRSAPPPGQPAKRAAETGETLVDEGQAGAVPAYDVGGTDPVQEGALAPTHKPAIAWPADRAVSRKPFKI